MTRPEGMSEEEFDRLANDLVNKIGEKIAKGLTRKIFLPVVLATSVFGSALLYGFVNGATYVLTNNRLQRIERMWGEDIAHERASLTVQREEPWYFDLFSYGSKKAAREYLENAR